ncbi:MAG: hypothetical protein ACR2J7_00690 [Luteimonas sp.]
MKIVGLLLVPALSLLAFAGCNQQSPDGPPSRSAEADGAPANPAKGPGAIPPGDLDLAFRVTSGPTYDPATDTVTYQVEAANNGKATLASEGELAVNVAVVVRGSDGTLGTPPANLDFMRVEFPKPLAPGQIVTLPIMFNVGSTLGGTVVVDAVQERVSWFSDYGKPVLTLGKFNRCNEAPNTLCEEDGTPVPAAQ